jgi:uncharacterized protein YkwD
MTMRPSIWLALATGCGQMYQAPGGPQQQPPPGPVMAPPDEPRASAPPGARPEPAAMPDAMAPGAAPADPYRGTPATAHRPPRPTSNAPSSEAEALVTAHNQVRAKHCAAPLTWSPKLAQIAQQWAKSLRDQGCKFGHSGGQTGENLAAGTSGTLDPEAVVKMWYDEVALYRFPDGGFSMKTGHFTQVVWRGTTHVGCGRSQCNGMDIWVCEYDPAGNWEGQYRENVLPTSCRR